MTQPLTRDFTVAVFVVHSGHVLLHPHPKLGIWLPPGGHIDAPELPDEAAVREVREESGLEIELIGERGIELDAPGIPEQLVRPAGIQLEDIHPGHQHIDLVYFAQVLDASQEELPEVLPPMRWLQASELAEVGVNAEVTAWAMRALEETIDG